MAGRVLGGTSNLNFNLYVRGRPKDFDTWAEQGAIGWNWKNILNYFIRSENNTNKILAYNGNNHSIKNADKLIKTKPIYIIRS